MNSHSPSTSPAASRSLLSRVHFSWGVILICVVAALIGVYKAWLMIDEPLLGADSGFRVFRAQLPVTKIGNRVWLPFLQGHIHLYHLLGLPFAGLKLITGFYFTLATVCVGLYWHRILGEGVRSIALAIVATVGLAAHWLSIRTGELMQEPVGVGLFFAFLFIASTGRALSMAGLVVAAAALLTRDAYWIYLFAVTFVAIRQSPWDFPRIRGYAMLWAVPILWLVVCIPAIYLKTLGRLPTFPIEWPLMYNPVAPGVVSISSAESLWIGLVRSHVLPVAAGVALAASALAFWRRKRFFELFDDSEFVRTAIRAAPIAIAIVYGLILVLNPWQVTPGNARAAWPLLEISFAVAPLLIKAAESAPTAVRRLVTVAIVAGLAVGVHPSPIRSRDATNIDVQREHAKLGQIVAAPASGDNPNICVMAADVWTVYRELTAPLFLNRKIWVDQVTVESETCDLLIVEADVGITVPESFRLDDSISVNGRRWDAYRR